MCTLMIAFTLILEGCHILSHGHALVLSFNVELFFDQVKVSLGSVAGFSESFHLLFALLEVSAIGQDLVLDLLALW